MAKRSFLHPKLTLFSSKCIQFVEMNEDGSLSYQKMRKEGRKTRKTFQLKPKEIISFEERDEKWG